MKAITITLTIVLWVLSSIIVTAQETEPLEEGVQERITLLEQGKEGIIEDEKELLGNALQRIMKRLENNEISESEANALKQSKAEEHALNIENKLAIIDNKIALLIRNGYKYDSFNVKVKFNDRTIIKNKIPRYERRTYSSTVMAVGLNNVIIDGQSLNDSPYKVGGSRFFELGHAWATRILKNEGWLRLKYGFSFQFNGLKPEGNNSFIKEDGNAVLTEFPVNLDKAKLRLDNLVIPVHFEFGPATRKEKNEKVYFNTHRKIKIGLGGYGGLRLGSVQKLKFKEAGEAVRQKTKFNSTTNNFVYGLSGYIGWDSMSIYAKYDLSPIFKNGPEQRNVSLGLRFDMD
jgi:hypothetical protein